MQSRPSLFAGIGATLLCAVITTRAQVPAQGRGGRGGAVALPDGAGKASIEAYCSKCHSLGNIVNSGGYTQEGWKTLIASMIALPSEQADVLTAYLAAHFPEKPRPGAVVIAGPANVTFREFLVPTLGSRPHDPLYTPDDGLWYTGQFANKLGRVDLKTGAIKEYDLPEGSGPHGLAADSAGNIWYTANAKGYIGKLDPKTGNVTQYQTPGVNDPHTPLFDQKGILWFSAQNANMMGRLDPKTGDLKMIPSATPRSNPYGVVVNSKGMPFIVLFGTNKVAAIEPMTMEIKEYVLPDPATRPRRVAITTDDMIWYGDYSRGYLGRLDPKTGQVTEWPSPGGPQSQPYAITASKDIIWYSESGVRPNTLVRFDPRTEKFQTWLIPSGGGVVRNMMPTKDGNLVIAESGVNKVALVEIAK